MGCGDSKAAGASEPKAKPDKPAAKPADKPADKPAANTEDAPAVSSDAGSDDSGITLIYFNGKGRAELIRLLLTLNKKEFTDKRISFAEWADLKPSLTGSSIADAALIDDVVDYITDILKHIGNYALIQDEEEKAAALPGCLENVTPMMERLDTYVSKCTSGYLVGDAITWGDYSLFLHCENVIQFLGQEFFDKFTNLCTHYKKIMDSPGVSEYIAARPANDF